MPLCASAWAWSNALAFAHIAVIAQLLTARALLFLGGASYALLGRLGVLQRWISEPLRACRVPLWSFVLATVLGLLGGWSVRTGVVEYWKEAVFNERQIRGEYGGLEPAPRSALSSFTIPYRRSVEPLSSLLNYPAREVRYLEEETGYEVMLAGWVCALALLGAGLFAVFARRAARALQLSPLVLAALASTWWWTDATTKFAPGPLGVLASSSTLVRAEPLRNRNDRRTWSYLGD